MCRCSGMDWAEAERAEMVDEVWGLAETGGVRYLDAGRQCMVSWSRNEREGSTCLLPLY